MSKKGIYTSSKTGKTHKFRSSWEKVFMEYLDKESDVYDWDYESVKIEYISNKSLKRKRIYYPDFLVDYSDKILIIEIKPSKRVLQAKNQKKFKAARDFCEKLGWEFVIFTENELKVMNLLALHCISQFMGKILGLDVSTSVIGICLIDSNTGEVQLDHVALKDVTDNILEKADIFEKKLVSLANSDITHVYIEKPFVKFAPGGSSAQTIAILQEFNGIVSYICKKTLNVPVEKVSVKDVREKLGIHLLSKKKGGPHKEQVFKYVTENLLTEWEFPKKRTGKVVDWAKDEIDAYVVAKYGILTLSI